MCSCAVITKTLKPCQFCGEPTADLWELSPGSRDPICSYSHAILQKALGPLAQAMKVGGARDVVALAFAGHMATMKPAMVLDTDDLE